MGSRLKEDEKNERAIRSLLKQTPNRRCINCNSLGPQYVCLNFWTFVCTTCSGIHREFTHRVKSVSMSKFSSQEVSALQSGGNERAREIYFKDWDPQRQPLPDSSNVDKLREFIKSVYVDKRFSGERSLPRGKGADREEAYESKRPEPRSDYRADSRSPPYEDKYEDRRSGPRRSEVGIDDRRYEDRAGRYDERRSPGRFDYDRNRYDKTYNDTRRYEDRGRYDSRDRQYDDRYNEGLDRRFEERFTHERRWSENPRHQRDYSGGSPPPIRPVKEILGDDIPPLRVEDHINGSHEGDSLQRSQKDARGQRFGSSSSFGSVDGNAPVSKTGISESLIDFSAEPEAPAVGVQSEPFGFSVAQPTASTSNSTGWATFDMFSTATTAAPGSGVAEGFNNQSVQMNGAGQWPNQWASMQAGPSLAAPAAATTLSHVSSPDAWSSLAGPDYQPSNSVTNSQVWSPFAASTMPTGPKPSTSDQLQAGNSQELQNASTSSTGMQIGSNANKQRQAIPEDFFTSLYPERNSSNMGFQMGLQAARAPPFGPQFSAFGGVGLAGQMLSYGQTAKSRNPFDFPGETPSTSTASEFPSMSPLQAALPNLNVGMMPLPGPGARAVGSQWPQSSLVASQPASYPSAVPTGAGFFIGQQMPSANPLTMQVGSMGFTSGMGMPGGYMHAPPPSASDSLFPGQRAPLAQNLLNVVPTDSSFLGQGATELTPQSLLGQVGGNTVVLDSLHPPQRALQYLPQNSLVPPGSNTTGPDSLFLQKAPQFPSQSSLGPLGGNPFG